MSESSGETIHGPDGGSHRCLWCGIIYTCVTVHAMPWWPRLEGGRCCAPCRAINVRTVQRLGLAKEVMYGK